MNYATEAANNFKREQESQRLATYGAPPVTLFKTLRQNLGLSHEQLGRQAYVSKQALIRLEQGTFERPLPSVVDWWVMNHGVSELRLVDNYEHFQQQMRKRHRLYFGEHIQVDPLSDIHPFRQLRQRCYANPSEVAKALCLPQATLNHFERKFKTQQSVPKQLLAVLAEIGYSSHEITDFVLTYDTWRKRFTGSNILVLEEVGGVV